MEPSGTLQNWGWGDSLGLPGFIPCPLAQSLVNAKVLNVSNAVMTRQENHRVHSTIHSEPGKGHHPGAAGPRGSRGGRSAPSLFLGFLEVTGHCWEVGGTSSHEDTFVLMISQNGGVLIPKYLPQWHRIRASSSIHG